MDASSTMKIVIVGKTGAGKSSLANTIFGGNQFKTGHTLNSETKQCYASTTSVNGRSVTLIDTPGFFDTHRSEEDMKKEIVSCIVECAPGPHAFLIVLKVERYTEHEQAVVNKIQEYFSEDIFRYATVLFTHGDQLEEKETIKDLVQINVSLSDLVKKCGDRCHVIDNRYWKDKPKDEYRSNQFQVEELLKTVHKMTEENQGGCYTNEMLQIVEQKIQQEEEKIRQKAGNLSDEEIREQAKAATSLWFLNQMAGIAAGVLFGAFFGTVESGRAVLRCLKKASNIFGKVVDTAAKSENSFATEFFAVVTSGVRGIMKGVRSGSRAAEEADSPWSAMKKAADAAGK